MTAGRGWWASTRGCHLVPKWRVIQVGLRWFLGAAAPGKLPICVGSRELGQASSKCTPARTFRS